MITLTYQGVVQELPDRLIWVDEYQWSPVDKAIRTATNGAMHVHVGKRLAGRPYTLNGQIGAAWIERSVCDLLKSWADDPLAELSLFIRGSARTVIWNQEGGLAFEATPIWMLIDGEHTSDLKYIPNFRFKEK
ncbi:MAG: hypothetical protein RSD57_14520 [Comamonas sp.]